MSALTIFSVKDPQNSLWHSTNAEEIQQQLNAKGVRFERWQADRDLGANPSPETVIAAYQHAIDKLVAEKGYQSWDVISLRADNPQKEALREKFLNEHTHGEDEVRFFVEGAGLFCLHIGDEVFQVLCEKNDLISVPAHTPHWFDMGSEPNFTAIRIFDNPEAGSPSLPVTIWPAPTRGWRNVKLSSVLNRQARALPEAAHTAPPPDYPPRRRRAPTPKPQ